MNKLALVIVTLTLPYIANATLTLGRNDLISL